MTIHKKIRLFWLWAGMALLVELAAFTLWKRWYWFFPTGQVSELYTKYSGTEGLNVAFFKDYRIDDTVSVDVTLLEAITDSAWVMLQAAFGIPELTPELESLLPVGEDPVFSKLARKGNYTEAVNGYAPDIEIIGYSYGHRTVSVFHTTSLEGTYAILHHNYNKSTNQ